jgi:RNA-directed DNA polymerase
VDLEKFFDRVNHDVLMARLAKRVGDKRLLRVIRRYLEAGVLADGVVVERHEGTPQGGPLSPLLANVLLDEVDRCWSGAVTALCATPMTAMCTCSRSVPESE